MKNKIISFAFVIFLFTFFFLHIFTKDLEVSYSERRKLATFPSFELSAKYTQKIEKYLLDHFPCRDEARKIKAYYNFNILNRLENNKIYIKDENIYKSYYPTNDASIFNFINKTDKILENFNHSNVYMLIVPDKNYYLNDKNFLQIDYDYIYTKLEGLDLNIIDIRNVLNKEDYYYTDTHWRQENLEKVVQQLSKSMYFNYKKDNYKQNLYNNFYGVYYSDAAINSKVDDLIYLTNPIIDNAYVKYLENPKLNKVYNLDKLNSLDSYEVYLDGASSFIEIYNPNDTSGKELIIFRDSFASSLAPLLIKYYSKITLIDNRYINSDNYLKYLDYNNQDVLLIYSTMLINNSFTLKG